MSDLKKIFNLLVANVKILISECHFHLLLMFTSPFNVLLHLSTAATPRLTCHAQSHSKHPCVLAIVIRLDLLVLEAMFSLSLESSHLKGKFSLVILKPVLIFTV